MASPHSTSASSASLRSSATRNSWNTIYLFLCLLLFVLLDGEGVDLSCTQLQHGRDGHQLVHILLQPSASMLYKTRTRIPYDLLARKSRQQGHCHPLRYLAILILALSVLCCVVMCVVVCCVVLCCVVLWYVWGLVPMCGMQGIHCNASQVQRYHSSSIHTPFFDGWLKQFICVGVVGGGEAD